MGRYYSGDIDGKFMFAVQGSDAADRFGSTGTNNYLEYWFDDSHLGTISKELSTLKPAWKKVNKFFEESRKSGRTGYTDDDVKKAGISNSEMIDYADYVLGKKIQECIKENGECNFTAEI